MNMLNTCATVVVVVGQLKWLCSSYLSREDGWPEGWITPARKATKLLHLLYGLIGYRLFRRHRLIRPRLQIIVKTKCSPRLPVQLEPHQL